MGLKARSTSSATWSFGFDHIIILGGALTLHSIKFESSSDNISVLYHVDSYELDKKNNKIYVKGWAFDPHGRDLKVSSDTLKYEIDHVARIDVYKAFESSKYENSIESGFIITVYNALQLDLFKLKFMSNSGFDDYEINVKLIKRNLNELTLKKLKFTLNFENLSKAWRYFRVYGLKNLIAKVKSTYTRLNENDDYLYDPRSAYLKWIDSNENYDIKLVEAEIGNYKLKPFISVVVPVYNVNEKWLRKCIESVISQCYTRWELCIADDCSTKNHIKAVLEEYKQKDSRIKVVYREENGHISKATNSALNLATGEFVALLDNDDELSKYALYEVVKLINRHPEAELIYSDEDKIDTKGNRKDPHFKPQWSPDTLLSCNYITHLCVLKKSILDKIGGFRVGYEGSQDYDVILRVSEQTEQIFHIPKILYHWRLIEGSTSLGADNKNYCYPASIRVLRDALERRKETATIEKGYEQFGMFNISFSPRESDYISIIIPTKNKANILKQCLDSIYIKNKYKNFEVIVIDNGSTEDSIFKLFDEYSKKDNFSVLTLDMPFNYSKLNNEAAKIAKGNLLLFLNNDIEVISENWLEEMAGQAIRQHIGAVGVKLLYPNNTIQHCGIVIGFGGVAGNAYSGTPKEEDGYASRLKINYNYSAVTAACLMLRKDLFFEISGFTEELAVAFNDVDLCLKLLEKNYFNLCMPKIELYHHESLSRGSDSTPENIDRFIKEQNYMKDRWKKWIMRDPFYNPNFRLTDGFFYISEHDETSKHDLYYI